ncbi:MAG: hypothetical protein GY861_11100 [bacterium]|nr:hypothetical protein [bacterium]
MKSINWHPADSTSQQLRTGMMGMQQFGEGMTSLAAAYRQKEYQEQIRQLEMGLGKELMGVPVGEQDVFADLQGNMTKRENFPDYGTPPRKMEPSRELYNEFLDQHKDDNRQLDLNKYNQWLQQNRQQQEQYFPPMRPQQVTRRRPLTQEERTAVIDKYNRKLKVANSYMPKNERVEPFEHGGMSTKGMTPYQRESLKLAWAKHHKKKEYKPDLFYNTKERAYTYDFKKVQQAGKEGRGNEYQFVGKLNIGSLISGLQQNERALMKTYADEGEIEDLRMLINELMGRGTVKGQKLDKFKKNIPLLLDAASKLKAAGYDVLDNAIEKAKTKEQPKPKKTKQPWE